MAPKAQLGRTQCSCMQRWLAPNLYRQQQQQHVKVPSLTWILIAFGRGHNQSALTGASLQAVRHSLWGMRRAVARASRARA